MKKYEDCGIYELRAIGREVGVRRPSIYKREDLIKKINEIENGVTEHFVKKTKQGRPAKDINIQNIKNEIENGYMDENLKDLVEKYKLLCVTLINFNAQFKDLLYSFFRDIDTIL